LQDYADKAEYLPIIKRLEDACEDCAVRYLYSGKNPAGVIFYLKNKHGWTDKQEVINTSIHVLAAPDDAAQLLAGIAGYLRAKEVNVTPRPLEIEAKTEPI
jgi:hypothetical protein